MNRTTTELTEEIKKSLALIRTLRDEVRVKAHLAHMDAKEEWKKLEPELARLERAAVDATEATHRALENTVKRLTGLLASLK